MVNIQVPGGGGAGNPGTGGNNVDGDGGFGKTTTIITTANASTASVGQNSGLSSVTAPAFAGGGGGGAFGDPCGDGGEGGGGDGNVGNGSTAIGSTGFPGTANTGGGGGGAGSYTSGNAGGAGGSGVVILRFASTITYSVTGITVGNEFTENSGSDTDTVLVFKSGSGTITLTGSSVLGPKVGDLRTNEDQTSGGSASAMEHFMSTGWRVFNNTTLAICNYPTTATALYQFDNNVTDTCGNYNGTAYSLNPYVAGKFGKAASFNGSSSYIDTSLTIPVNSSFSTSCWINISSAQSQGFIIAEGDWNAWSTASFGIAFTGSSIIELSIGNNGGSGGTQVQSSSSISLNNWTNIVGVIDIGNTLKLYINGIESATRPLSSNNRNAGSPSGFKFGAANSSYYFNGLIDQVRIFPSALTPAQVTLLYNES